MKKCKINRDNSNNIISVLAPNNEDSKLFKQIKSHVDENAALIIWAATQTDLFKSLYKDLPLDDNQEPILLFDPEEKVIYFPSKEGSRIMEHNIKSAKYNLYNENIKDDIKNKNESKDNLNLNLFEAILEEEIIDASEPLSNVVKMVLDQYEEPEALEKIKLINNRFKGVLSTLKKFNKLGEKIVYTKEFDSGNNITKSTLEGVEIKGVTFTSSSSFTQDLLNYNFNYDRNLSVVENYANWRWRNKQEEERLQINNNWYNKKEYINETEKRITEGSVKGNIIHLRDQLNYAPENKKEEILNLINEEINKANRIFKEKNIKNDKGETKELKSNVYDWVKDSKKILNERYGISSIDTVLHEVHIVSDILQIQGYIDKLIIRTDGSLVIRDTKTSDYLLNEAEYIHYFKYNKNYEVNDLNKAKVQIMTYAIAMALENPNIKFNNLGIDMLSNWNRTKSISSNQELSSEDIRQIIIMLLEYYKTEHPLIYSKIEKHPYALKTVLNPNNTALYTSSTEITSFIDSQGNINYNLKPNTENTLNESLKKMTMGIGFKPSVDELDNMNLLKGSKSKLLVEDIYLGVENFIKAWSKDENDNTIWRKDISWMNIYIGGNTGNVRNPLVKIYNEYFTQQLLKVQKEHETNVDKMNVYLIPALKKFSKDKFGDENFLFNQNKKFKNLSLTKSKAAKGFIEFWQQFYKTIEDNGTKITVRKTAEEVEGIENKALLNFLDTFYDNYLNPEKKSFLYETATYSVDRFNKAKPINHIDVMNGLHINKNNGWSYKSIKTLFLSSGEKVEVPFTPRNIYLGYEKDYLNGNSEVSPFSFKKFMYNILSAVLVQKVESIDQTETSMIPIKYLGNVGDNINNYSKDLSYQFISFSRNIVEKKHLDMSLALGEAMAMYIKNKVNPTLQESQQIKNLPKLLKISARWQNKQEVPDSDLFWMRKTTDSLIKLNITLDNPNTNQKETFYFSLYKFIVALKKHTAYAIMSFGLFGAINNFVQIVTTSIKTGASFGMITKKALNSPDDKNFWDFLPQHYIKGVKIAMEAQESAIEGDPFKSKIYLFLRNFRYLPSTLDFIENEDQLMTLPKRLGMDMRNTMFMNTAVEEYNAAAILYAQLQKKEKVLNKTTNKIEEKTLWDLYDVKSFESENSSLKRHDLQWNNNYVRFEGKKRYIGGEWKEITELTEQEIISLKRKYERIQGSYRQEERSILELTVLGSLYFQFKRYLPAIIRNQFQSRKRDSSLGYYTLRKDANGDEIVQWKERMITGKWRLMFDLFFNGILNKLPFVRKNKFVSFSKPYSLNDLELDEQIQLYDALFTSGLFFVISALAATRGKDDGDDDSFKKLLDRLSSTVIQPWSLLQSWENIKDLKSIPAGMLFNIMKGVSDFGIHSVRYIFNYEDSMTTEKGDIPGARLILKSLPFTKPIKDIYDWKENLKSNIIIR